MLDSAKENRKRFGRRLAIARTRCGLTQEGLALLSGTKQAVISRYELGNAIPRDDTLRKIAELLQEDYNWLKYGDSSVVETAEEDGVKTITINHLDHPDNSTSRSEKISKINNDLLELSDDSVSIVNELTSALTISENSDLQEELKKKEDTAHKWMIKAARNVKKTSPEIEQVNALLDIKARNPELFKRYEKNPGTANEIIREDRILFLKENYPVLYEKYLINPTDDTLGDLIHAAMSGTAIM